MPRLSPSTYSLSYYVSGSLSIFHCHKNVLSLTQVFLQIFILPSFLHFLKSQAMSLEPTSFLSELMGCISCTLNSVYKVLPGSHALVSIP